MALVARLRSRSRLLPRPAWQQRCCFAAGAPWSGVATVRCRSAQGPMLQLRHLAAQSSVPTVRGAGGDAVSLEGVAGETSLEQLSERAGFVPRPDVYDEKIKPGFRGGKALLIFFLCNAMPFTALVYYLREQAETRAQMSIGALPRDADEVATEVLRVIRTSSTCFLLADGDAKGGGAAGGVLRIDPHAPEGTAFVPPTEPLPLVPHIERNDLTDLLESPKVPGLGFIHFAVARSSSAGKSILAGHRRASLLYNSTTRGGYCQIQGQISILSDPESRRHYWKGLWSYSFPPPPPPAAVRPGAPSAAPAAAQAAEVPEVAPPWTSEEYLLLRLAVSEASLQASIDGPQRWESRRIARRADAGASDGEAAKWQFVASA